MNDSWSSEDAAFPPPPQPSAAEGPGTEHAAEPGDEREGEEHPPPRRSDRHARVEEPTADRRHPWVGFAVLLVGLAVGGAGLASIALELDRPGVREVPPERWWLVVGGGLAAAWSAPWFLRPRGRRRMAIALAAATAVVLAVAAVAIAGLVQ